MIKKNYLINFLWLSTVAAALFFICNDPIALFNKTIFYIFQERDMDRAQKILSGHAIFFGPEMTGGGYLPGPLYYLFLSAALYFKSSWVSAWIMQYSLIVLAALIGAFYFRKRFSTLTALLWIVLFSSARFTTFFSGLFLNVSSMFIFAVGALVCIHKILEEGTEKKRANYYYLLCLITGMGIQFHFSLISLFISALLILLFGSRHQIATLPLKKIITGLLILLLPSLPYLVWINFSKLGMPFGEAGFYNGKSDEAVTSILYLLKLGLSGSWNRLLLSWINKFLFTVPFALLVLVLTNIIFKLLSKEDQNGPKIFSLRTLLFYTAFAAIPHLNWYFSTQGMRYSMPFYLSLIFLTLFLFNSMILSAKKIKLFNILGAIIQSILIIAMFFVPSADIREYLTSTIIIITFVLIVFYFSEFKQRKEKNFLFSIVLLISLTVTQKHLIYNTIGTDGYMPNSSDWKHTWEIIFSQTGWTYNEAKGKIYYIGHHVNQAPELFLTGANFDHLPKPLLSKNMPDGFFVSNRFKKNAKFNPVHAGPLKWLLKQNLQKNVAEALRAGNIKLGQNLSRGNLIIPYWIINSEGLPSHLHNTGEGYHMSQDDLKLQQVKETEGIKKIGEDEYLFKWNESPDQNPYCSTGAIVSISRLQKNNYSLNIKVLGGAISQISPWVSPNWTQAWINPYVEVSCGSVVKNIPITDSIGFRRDYSHFKWTPFFSGNNSLVAPLEKKIEFSCNGKLKTLRLGRQKSLVEKITSVATLGPKELELIL